MGGVFNTPNFQYPRTPAPLPPLVNKLCSYIIQLYISEICLALCLSVSLSTGVSDLIFTADLFTLVNCRKTTVFPPWGPPNIMGKLSYISFSVDLSTVNNCSTLSLSDNNDYPVHMLHTHPRRLLSAESAIQSSVLRLESRPVSRPVCRPVFRPV